MANLEAITQVLIELDEYPEQSRTMMMEGLPHALGHERHEYQDRLLALVQGMLEDARRFAAGKQAAADEKAKLEEAELQAQQTSCNEAVGAAEAARIVALDKTSLLEKAMQAVRDAERHHKEAEREESRLSKTFNQFMEEKNKVAYVFEGSFLMLAEGGWEDEEAKYSAIEAVRAYLESNGAEKVLVAAAPMALGTKAESRKPFDRVTVEHIRGMLEEKVRDISTKVEQERPAVEEAKAEVLGAWALADVTREDMQRAEHDSNVAKAAHQASQKLQEDAQVRVRTQETAQKVAATALEQASDKVHLVDKALADFEQLKAGSPPAEVAEDAEMLVPKDVEMITKEQPMVQCALANTVLGVPTPMSA